MTRTLATIGLLAFLAGCGTTVQFTPTNASPRPLVARSADSVAIITTGTPNQPYVEVGLLEARQESAASSDEMPEIIQAMRQEAATIGCDAVVLNGRADTYQSSVHTDSQGRVHGSGTTLEGYIGTCIVFAETSGGQVAYQ